MGETNARTQSVSSVLLLSTTLAEQVFRSKGSWRALSDDQLAALLQGARFLYDHNVPWPSVLKDVVETLAQEMESVRTASTEAEAARRVMLFQ